MPACPRVVSLPRVEERRLAIIGTGLIGASVGLAAKHTEAAAAVGSDGIIVEAHPSPEQALCDGPQQIPTAEFAEFARQVREVAELLGRRIG